MLFGGKGTSKSDRTAIGRKEQGGGSLGGGIKNK